MTDPRFKDLPLSDELTERQRQLFVRASEEAAELIIAVQKTLRFGPFNHHPDDPTKETNVAAIGREFEDLIGVLEEIGREFGRDWAFPEEAPS